MAAEELKGLWRSFLRASTFTPPKDEQSFPEFLRALASPGLAIAESRAESPSPPLYCICVVSFQQGQGSVLDFQYPVDLPCSPQLPALALPDNAHRSAQDFTCFTVEIGGKMRYGTACFRQAVTDESRTALQKAVVVVATKPLYAWLKGNLEGITDSFWHTECLDTKILITAFETLKRAARTAGIVPLAAPISVTSLVRTLREDILTLWKLLLLESRTILFSESSGKVSSAYLSLLSLFPGQLAFGHASFLPTRFRDSLQQYGLPLDLAYSGYLLSPSVSMAQLASLSTPAYFIGSTNQRIAEGSCSQPQAVLDLDAGEFTLRLPSNLNEAVELSKQEREFARKVVCLAEQPEEKRAETAIRAEFHNYAKQLLANIAYVQALRQDYEKVCLKVCVKPYNTRFLLVWSQTHNFQVWKGTHPPLLASLSQFAPLASIVSLLFDNGDKYQGSLLAGLRQGRGVQETIGGEVYEGEWKQDHRSGLGCLISAEGLYKGRFAEGKFEGEGAMAYKNGDSYEGSWKAGKRWGAGRLQQVSGDVYIGNFANDVYEGEGQLAQSSGVLYNGEFHLGLFHGVGHLIYPSGDTFQGLFEKGIRSGPGAVVKPDGRVVNGYYEEDHLQQESCEVCFPSGLLYRGPVDSDLQPDGQGYLLTNGEVLPTEWRHGTEVLQTNRVDS